MMTLNEVAVALNDRIEQLKADIAEIQAESFDELYLGKQIAYEQEVRYLTDLRDKILGE